LRAGSGCHRDDGIQAPRGQSATGQGIACGPELLLKIIPHVDGTPRICELVEYHLEDVTIRKVLAAP
jgi:acetoacetate decarboxylase